VSLFLIVSASFLWAITAQAQSNKSDFDLVCAVTTASQMNQDEQRAAATHPTTSKALGMGKSRKGLRGSDEAESVTILLDVASFGRKRVHVRLKDISHGDNAGDVKNIRSK
jgi:hypothetical protein